MCIDVLFHSGEYFMNCHKSRPATGNGRVWRVAMSGCGEWQWAGVASGNGQLWRVAVSGCGEWQRADVASGNGRVWRVATGSCGEWQWAGVASGNGRLWRVAVGGCGEWQWVVVTSGNGWVCRVAMGGCGDSGISSEFRGTNGWRGVTAETLMYVRTCRNLHINVAKIYGKSKYWSWLYTNVHALQWSRRERFDATREVITRQSFIAHSSSNSCCCCCCCCCCCSCIATSGISDSWWCDCRVWLNKI